MKKQYSKMLPLFITGLMIIVIIAAVFWYKGYMEKTRELIDYVPSKAVVFVEFSLADEDFNNYLNSNSRAKQLLEEFLITNELPANIWRGEAEIDKLAMALIPLKKGGLGKMWLIHGRKDVKQLEAMELTDYYYTVFGEQVAVLSKSREAIKTVQGGISFNGLRAAGRNFKKNGLISGYIRDSMWQEELEIFLSGNQLIEKNISLGKNSMIYWWMELENDDIVFNLDMPLENSWIDGINHKKSFEDFFLLDNSAMVRNLRLENILKILEDDLKERDEINWELLEGYLNEKYQIKIDELYTFFEQPILLVVKPKKAIVGIEDLLNFNNYFYALVWDVDFISGKEDSIGNLESFIQNYLAFKFPETVTKILPDKTVGLELAVKPEKFEWQSALDKKFKIKFIKYEKGEMAYGQDEEKFILANSRELIKEILKSQKIEEDEYFSVRFDSGIIDNKYFHLANWILLGSELKGDRLLIKGKIKD